MASGDAGKKSSIQESIIEDQVQEKTDSIPSASIADDIPDEVISRVDDISEDSYLKDSFASAKQTKKKEAPKKPVKPVPAKIDRIRENIEDDYENDGFEDYSQSLKATELAK